MSYTYGQMNFSQFSFLESNEKLCHLKSYSTTVLPQLKLNLSKNNELNNQKTDRQIVLYYNNKLEIVPFTKSIKDEITSTKLSDLPKPSVVDVSIISNSNALVTKSETNVDNITKNCNPFYHQWSCTTLLKKILLFCQFIKRNIYTHIKKNYKKFSALFGTIYAANLKSEDRLANLIPIIRSENEYLLSIFGKKITNVMQELSQIRMSNEETLSILKKEIAALKESNELLTQELKIISNAIESNQINSKVNVPQPQKSILVTEFSTPPPPPPPLPSPPSSFSPSTTPKSTKKNKGGYTFTKKLSITSEKQPPIITVEELRKVKLKKAPEKNNKENEKNIGLKPHGPVISLDMLKKVKLKSIKCKTENDQSVRQPLRTLKDNGSQLTLEF